MTGGRGDYGTVQAHRARAQRKLADQLLNQRREELLAQQFRVQLNELANRAVIGLHPAAHPQRAQIHSRQPFHRQSAPASPADESGGARPHLYSARTASNPAHSPIPSASPPSLAGAHPDTRPNLARRRRSHPPRRSGSAPRAALAQLPRCLQAARTRTQVVHCFPTGASLHPSPPPHPHPLDHAVRAATITLIQKSTASGQGEGIKKSEPVHLRGLDAAFWMLHYSRVTSPLCGKPEPCYRRRSGILTRRSTMAADLEARVKQLEATVQELHDRE